MNELSLHILDLVENGIRAGASLIVIALHYHGHTLTMSITDNGCGMDEDMVKRVEDPFATSRKTRKVGLGISLFKEICQRTGGGVVITSTKGEGTKISGALDTSHIDCPPLGNLTETMLVLIQCNQQIDFVLKLENSRGDYFLDTREIRQVLGPKVPLGLPEVMDYIQKELNTGLKQILEGVNA